MSDDASVMLRPAREDDLPLLERFLFDPEAASSFQWFGWRDPDRFRRRFAENGLLGPDGGQLVVDTDAASGGPYGFVSWHKLTTRSPGDPPDPLSYCPVTPGRSSSRTSVTTWSSRSA